MSRQLEREIEALLEDRLGRGCVYVPSGRLALYVAVVASLEPGDRVLMSPVTDDVVLFTLLAAGVRPVMAPVSPADGNIDVEAVPGEVWQRLRAVMTTNLYGLPDQMVELRARCDELGIVLIEDAAHALETEVGGRPIGSFGELAAFSLSKHASGVGGAVAVADPGVRRKLERLRDEVVLQRTLRVRAEDALRPAVRAALERLALRGAAVRARSALGRVERIAFRMPLRAAELARAQASGPGLDGFESWVRVDKHDFRLAQREVSLLRTLERLRDLASDRAKRTQGVARLRDLAAAAPAARAGEPLALFRVPLLVDERDAVASTLEQRGIPAHYVYDPPLDDYAGAQFVDPSPAPESARWWAAHVLPVDPLRAGEALEGLRGVRTAAPAAPRRRGEPT